MGVTSCPGPLRSDRKREGTKHLPQSQLLIIRARDQTKNKRNETELGLFQVRLDDLQGNRNNWQARRFFRAGIVIRIDLVACHRVLSTTRSITWQKDGQDGRRLG